MAYSPKPKENTNILNHGTPEQIERAEKEGVGNSIEDICIEIMFDITD